MKKFLLLFFLFKGAFILKTVAQENAFLIAKEAIRIEQKIKQGELINRDTIIKVLGAIHWYADVQDYESSEQRKYVGEKLDGNYERLSTAYYKILSQLYKYEVIFGRTEKEISMDLEEITKKFPHLTTSKDWLKIILKPYWSLVAEKSGRDEDLIVAQRSGDSLAKAVELNQSLIKSINNEHPEIALKISSNTCDTGEQCKKYKTAKSDSLLMAGLLKKKKEEISKLNDQIKGLDSAINLKKDLLTRELSDSKDKKAELIAILSIINIHSERKTTVEQSDNEIMRSIGEFQRDKLIIKDQEEASLKLGFSFPSEAEMIDAIAIYLAKRVKQESVMWFFETIKKNAKQYDLLSTFFPNTITLLQGNEVYEIPNLGAQWRYALSKDFVKMPRNVFTSKWFSQWYDTLSINKHVNTRDFLIAAYDVCDLLSQKYSYNQLVKQMYLNLQNNSDKDTTNKITPANVFAILYAFNQECFMPTGKKDSSVRLMRYEDFRNATRDELEIMISLMDLKYANAFAPIWKAAGASQFLNAKNAELFRRWAGGIEAAIEQFNKVQADYLKLTKEVNDGKKIDAVYSAFNIWENVNGLINAIVPDTMIKDPGLRKVAFYMKSTKQHMETAFEVYHQLSLKNYAGAVNTTISLVEQLIYYDNDTSNLNFLKVFDTTKLKEGFKDKYILTRRKRLDSIRQKDNISALFFEKDRHAINLIRKLAGFLNDVMLTTDAKQLSKVVESYALPPGSYKRKRNSWWSLDLNAYVGAYWGLEKLKNEENGAKSWGGVYGITAPIGISISKTLGKRIKADEPLTEDQIRNPDKVRIAKRSIRRRTQSTLTLSINAVDIGAVVSYRFAGIDSSAKGLPKEVNWAQVISPGLRLSYGIPNTPLVISGGYQYTPMLRSVQDNGIQKMNNTHRLSVGVLFDLPLINLWQRSYWRGKYNKK
jgi:hypothetical protein